MSLGFQSMLVGIGGLLLGIWLEPMIPFISTGDGILWDIYFVLTYVFVPLTVKYTARYGLAPLLERIHFFLDCRYAADNESVYSSGYYAWSLVIVAAFVVVVAAHVPSGAISRYSYYMGCLAGSELGYAAFVERKKNDTHKKFSFMTSPMEALLERCRSWLPVPVPEPD